MVSHKSFIIIVSTLIAVAIQGTPLPAAVITQIVEFVTPTSGGQNQITVHGTLDTLAQGLREVDCGDAVVGVNGMLRARLTLETSRGDVPEIIGIEFLDSSFQQDGVSLFYDVPNTSRRITFTATNLQFALQFSDNNQLSQLAGPSIPANSYQLMQNGGMAEVAITNRPSRQQNLSQLSVLSSFDATQPAGQASFAILPPPDGFEQSLVELSLPLSHQQLYYAGVGLPVMLNYSGTLNLVAALPLISNQIPEPGTLVLLGSAMLFLGRRSPEMAFPG
jgi:hypothetical protein